MKASHISRVTYSSSLLKRRISTFSMPGMLAKCPVPLQTGHSIFTIEEIVSSGTRVKKAIAFLVPIFDQTHFSLSTHHSPSITSNNILPFN
jgi:hypothetical protein